MTSYNRLNGDVLRGATRRCSPASCATSGASRASSSPTGSRSSRRSPAPRAGLDLEMPGPGARLRAAALADAVRAGDVDETLLDAQARAPAGGVRPPRRARRPARAATSAPIDRPEHRALAREAAAESDRCCCATTACCRSTRRAALAGGDRPERRPRPDHGRRLGQAAAALPGRAARRVPRALRRRRRRRATSAGCDIDRTVPPSCAERPFGRTSCSPASSLAGTSSVRTGRRATRRHS